MHQKSDVLDVPSFKKASYVYVCIVQYTYIKAFEAFEFKNIVLPSMLTKRFLRKKVIYIKCFLKRNFDAV